MKIKWSMHLTAVPAQYDAVAQIILSGNNFTRHGSSSPTNSQPVVGARHASPGAKMPDNEPRQRKITRLRDYDYSSPGAYMVTICGNRRHRLVFGTLKNGSTVLSEIGRIIEKCWISIPEHFTGVSLDVWVIMPDHIHGILLFELKGEACLAPTTASVHCDLPKLGAVVGSFKAAATKEARKIGISKCHLWQRGYFEHVIRNQADLDRARDYIALNPLQRELED